MKDQIIIQCSILEKKSLQKDDFFFKTDSISRSSRAATQVLDFRVGEKLSDDDLAKV